MAIRSESQYNLLLATPTVTLIVGPEAARRTITQGMFILHSNKFANFVKDSPYWKQEGLTIQLHDASVSSVEIFISWAYQRRLHYPLTVDNNELIRRKEELIDLYIFADMYAVVALQNDVMDELIGIFGPNPSLLKDEDLEYIFERTFGNCALRKLAILALVVDIEDPTTEHMFMRYEPFARAHEGFFSFFCYFQRKWINFYNDIENEMESPKKRKVKKEAGVKREAGVKKEVGTVSYEPARLALLLQEEDVARRFKIKVPSTSKFVHRLLFEQPKQEEAEVIMIDD